MKKTVFLCVGGDARQTYTAQTLTKIGRVYTYGMDDKGEDTIPPRSSRSAHRKGGRSRTSSHES